MPSSSRGRMADDARTDQRVSGEIASPAVDAGRAPKLLDRVRRAIRAKHYSRRTESAYVDWIRRYIVFHRKRHPSDMARPRLSAFLPGSRRNVASAHRRRIRHSARSCSCIAKYCASRSVPSTAFRALACLFAYLSSEPTRGRARHETPGWINVDHGRTHVPALIRNAPARGWVRHPDRAGAARPRGRQYDDGVHARAQSWRAWRAQPGRSPLTANAAPVGREHRRPTTAALAWHHARNP